jgi:hypothetical protein
MTYAAYIPHIRPWPLPTNKRQNSTPEGRQFELMDVTCNQDLVEVRIEMLVASLPQRLAKATYTSSLSPRPLPTKMRPRSALQGRQLEGMNVTCNQDLVELWADMRAASLPPPGWSTLPTPASSHDGLYRRLCAEILHPMGVNLSLWTSLAIKIWWRYGLRCSPPPNGLHTLYLSHVAPVFTDDYAAG